MRLPQPVARPAFALAADALLAGEDAALPEPRLEFLRWLAADRDVVFHGSQRNDLVELSTERRSRDETEWGNQTAVYASSDPVWAIYFAVLRRDSGWRGTRNGTLGVGRWRFYFFSHNRGSASPDRFGPGSLYVLPAETFVGEERIARVIDTATSSRTSRPGRSRASTSRPRTSHSGTASRTTATTSRSGSRSCGARGATPSGRG